MFATITKITWSSVTWKLSRWIHRKTSGTYINHSMLIFEEDGMKLKYIPERRLRNSRRERASCILVSPFGRWRIGMEKIWN